MNKSLAVKTVVLVGIFEPTKFDKFFFIKNEILTEKEVSESSIFTVSFIQIVTKKIQITITVNQIILTEATNGNFLKSFATLFVAKSQPTLNAFGINFTWSIVPDNKLADETRRLFANENNKMFKTFLALDNSMYGSYASKDFKNGRLKLEIKPQVAKQIPTEVVLGTYLTCVFNFHFDVSQVEDYTSVLSTLEEYEAFYNESEQIISNYE